MPDPGGPPSTTRRLVAGAAILVFFGAVGLVAVSGLRPLPPTGGATIKPTASNQPRPTPRSTATTLSPHRKAKITVADLLPPLPEPTKTDPLRFLEIGDSLGEDLGFALEDQLQAGGAATVAMDALGDTGLSNAAYYDWPAHLVGDLAASRAQVLVVFLGANDIQGFDVGDTPVEYGTTAWVQAYRQRVDAVLHEAEAVGTDVVWVGMPPMVDADLNAGMQEVDRIYQEETAKDAGALYVPASVLATPGGAFLPDAVVGGAEEALRTPDGVHLTPAGAGLLCTAVLQAIDQHWHIAIPT